PSPPPCPHGTISALTSRAVPTPRSAFAWTQGAFGATTRFRAGDAFFRVAVARFRAGVRAVRRAGVARFVVRFLQVMPLTLAAPPAPPVITTVLKRCDLR